MGCDIHLYVERAVGDQWIPLKAVSELYAQYASPGEDPLRYDGWYDGRDYKLFNQLAGVRGSGEGIIPCWRLGLPDDVSDPVRACYDLWGGDVHSAGWYTARELLDFKGWESSNLYFVNDLVRRKLGPLGDPSKVRIVFWFDS